MTRSRIRSGTGLRPARRPAESHLLDAASIADLLCSSRRRPRAATEDPRFCSLQPRSRVLAHRIPKAIDHHGRRTLVPCDQVNKGHNKKRLNKKREKRIWSAEEENALVDILYEMNGSGWKADTGHKCGYMTYIEKELAKRFPNSNIKADPHIQSEVKKLKKMLSYVLDIQQHGSGFGWDDERKMSRNGALNLYMKPFVNYDKLCEIYANDLAKGSNAKGPGDHIDLLEEQSAKNTSEPAHQSESVVDSQSHLQCPGSNPSNGNKPSGSRKRKFVEDDAMSWEFSNLSKSLKNLVEVQTSNAAAMNVIQSAYAHELEAQKQTDKRREQLFFVLTKFPQFTRDELVKAALIIGQDATKLNMFFTTPEDFKSAFISEVLRSSN
nr:unnamed protein product [Digitaria exilis]